ncbi:MAG: hypothetical protein E6G94_12510 [Alphaproteobacteria bacterium]|nr:MAG: hypothetical protein E6G94_12510 [Alphaproteobacteria bacterium]
MIWAGAAFTLAGGMARLINPAARIETVLQGRESQPVILIDDMLTDPALWRYIGARAQFAPIRPYHPGVSAPLPAPLAEKFRTELSPLIGPAFGLDPVPPAGLSFLSLVTTPGEALAPIQRLPHVDGLEGDRIAILVYLSGADKGGTAFYRQRATGFETVDEGRREAFEAALEAGLAEHGPPPEGYISGDTALYEQVAAYEARENRGLIYRSHALHSAAVPPGAELSQDGAAGRLTLNLFLGGDG